jgi:hypothetical protein
LTIWEEDLVDQVMAQVKELGVVEQLREQALHFRAPNTQVQVELLPLWVEIQEFVEEETGVAFGAVDKF